MSGHHPPGPHPSGGAAAGTTEDHRVGRVEVELGRVTTRLVGLGPARLVRPGVAGVGAEAMDTPPGAPGTAAPRATPVELVRPVLQHLADVVAAAAGRAPRVVPELAPHALGDQLVVLVRDVLALPPSPGVAERLDDLGDRLVALRRALP